MSKRLDWEKANRKQAARPEPNISKTLKRIPAKWGGVCSHCERPYRVGELIKPPMIGTTGWRHSECGNV